MVGRLGAAAEFAADRRASVAAGGGDLVDHGGGDAFDHVGGDAVEDDEDGFGGRRGFVSATHA